MLQRDSYLQLLNEGAMAHHTVASLRQFSMIGLKSSASTIKGCMGQTPNPNKRRLEKAIQTKQKELEALLKRSTPAELESRLTSVESTVEPFKLLNQVSEVRSKGFTAIIVEVQPFLPAESSESLAIRCSEYASYGADAISVRIDAESTPCGLNDLALVSKAVNVPVICTDWIIHPVQIAEAVEAGASAVRLVYAVIKKGVQPLLGYCGSLGLDAVVEVGNKKELEQVEEMGASLYGINLTTELSGISSEREAQEMRLASADAVFIKQELIERFEAAGGSSKQFLQKLREDLSGDD
eukprot:TRINITY_DN1027_c0_g1_i2.p1 TRINITY_DN1027_c0_g1~~TRINITY_DN1027_c0_g1_i2.p1  ORF type:complete len:296 (-),score=62.30 TRINITY_DN1027_c0_g1_i2:397-1284(-)